MAKDKEREEFIKLWRDEARTAIQALIRDLVPTIEVNDRPATAADVASIVREFFSTNFDRYLQGATPPGVKFTPQEREDIRRVTMEVLSEEIRRRNQ